MDSNSSLRVSITMSVKFPTSIWLSLILQGDSSPSSEGARQSQPRATPWGYKHKICFRTLKEFARANGLW